MFNLIIRVYFLKIIFLFAILNKWNCNAFSIGSSIARKQRIIGGRNTTIAQHPYMVSIRYKEHFLCGGTLISQKCILTAAHCSILESPSNWEIHAGTSTIKNNGLVRKVNKWMVPSGFNFFTVDMDLAVVELDKPFYSRSIRPIQIDFRPLKVKDEVIVTGWGLKDEYPLARLSNELQAVKVNVIPEEKCSKAYIPYNNVTKNMFCALGNWGSDACQGDSGGPAIYDGKQVGIVSWGYRCGSPKYPGVYTRLSSPKVREFLRYLIKNYC